jgi:3-oxoacyl-[acyl-carrier protein] reductase
LVAAASVQLSASNIRVNGVAPGFTESSILTVSKNAEKGEYSNSMDQATIKGNHQWFFERAGLLAAQKYYYNRVQDPAEIANVQLFLASNAAACINGQMILCDSGKTAASMGEGCTGPVRPITVLDLALK